MNSYFGNKRMMTNYLNIPDPLIAQFFAYNPESHLKQSSSFIILVPNVNEIEIMKISIITKITAYTHTHTYMVQIAKYP